MSDIKETTFFQYLNLNQSGKKLRNIFWYHAHNKARRLGIPFRTTFTVT